MSSGAESLAGLFGMTDFMIPMVLSDLTEEQLVARPRGDGGPSIAWTVGHLLSFRGFMLERFGQPSGEASRFARFTQEAATDGSDYPGLEELLDAWETIGGHFVPAVSGLSEERLSVPVEGGLRPDQTLRDMIVFFAWHEGYHLGAIGQIRKELGLPGPAERVRALREAEQG